MKLKWTVTGTVTFTNSMVKSYSAVWELTFAEADEQVEGLIKEYLGREDVAGIRIRADANHGKAKSLIVRVEMK